MGKDTPFVEITGGSQIQVYKKVGKGKPHNVADAWHVDFPEFGGRSVPMVVDIGGVRQDVSELLQAV